MLINGTEWRLVPVEPTEDMTAAGFEALMAWDVRAGDDMGIEDTYSAMLAAAPTPPAHTEPSDEEIISLAYDCNALPEVITDESLKLFSRALLSRYGRQQVESADQVQALREALHAAAEYIGDRSAGSSTFWDLYDAAMAHGGEG